MKDIQRYELTEDTSTGIIDVTPVPERQEGRFVTYEDHAEILAAKDARISELVSREQWHSQRTASFDILNRKCIALQEQLSRYSMSPGWADQRQNESKYVREALGFGADADDVSPKDLVDAITALQEQVRALAAESARCRFEISRCHQTVDEMFKNREKWIDKEWLSSIWSTSKRLMDETPVTDAALREIRAQAVEEFAKHLRGHMQDGSPLGLLAMGADEFAARIRTGEQP